jgi:membrane-bound ClpP family serine protease
MTGLGMALLVIGAVVAIAEAHYPTHGIAGGIGVMAMAIGAVLAISGLGAGILLALLAGLALAAIGVGVMTLSLKQGVAVRRQRIRSGAETMVGQVGVVRSWADSAGSVALDGALWRARRSAARDEDDDLELHTGDPVVVERRTGLTLSVRRAEEWELML